MYMDKKSEVSLSVRHIIKTYPGVVALKDISVDFYAGEVHGLMGENGAGKSTLMKAISALTANMQAMKSTVFLKRLTKL